MKIQRVLPAALVAAALQTGAATAAVMQTMITGVVGPESFDNSSLFASVNDPTGVVAMPLEIIILWDSQPVGLDPANSTIMADNSKSTFLSLKGSGDGNGTGVTEARIMVDAPETNFASYLDWFSWTRTNDAASGKSSLSMTFHGSIIDGREYLFEVSLTDIMTALPLNYDATIALASGAYASTGSFLLKDADGQPNLFLNFNAATFATVNLDGPVDPSPAEVPLPGAVVLLVSGLGALTGLRRYRS